jgi:hypothetical protein
MTALPNGNVESGSGRNQWWGIAYQKSGEYLIPKMPPNFTVDIGSKRELSHLRSAAPKA